ncbi:hypothetical protein ABEB36_004903 [Hypothenemus hampei]|uniref:CD164 n=1 Tax=Hypothenemus hampei TaxID=57062 RepID=A0ABD1EX88_HYPHA
MQLKIVIVLLVSFSCTSVKASNAGHPVKGDSTIDVDGKNYTAPSPTEINPPVPSPPSVEPTQKTEPSVPPTTVVTPITSVNPTSPTNPNTSTLLPPSSTTKKQPTSVPDSSTVPPHHDRKFDGPSFVGGIILAIGLIAIGFFSFQFYKARTERNYHTL